MCQDDFWGGILGSVQAQIFSKKIKKTPNILGVLLDDKKRCDRANLSNL